jgi:5-methylcytosine-specific restriction endonuclease McrA
MMGTALEMGSCGTDNVQTIMDDSGPALHLLREHPLTSSVLVLNRNYTAVRIVSARRAFALLCKDFAEVIDNHETDFSTFDFAAWIGHSEEHRRSPGTHDQFVATPRFLIVVPRVIRLRDYDKVPTREVKFSRRNILARDENRCQYCGKRLSASQLSLDHVTPKSRGGKSTWMNVVAACNPCNTRKGGRMPWEASMKLRKAPAVPRKNPALADKIQSGRYQVWRHFLGDGEMAIDA